MLNIIDSEVERVVEEIEMRAEHVLRASRSAVRETAEALVEHETLSGVALDVMLSTVKSIDLSAIPLPESDTDARRRGLTPLRLRRHDTPQQLGHPKHDVPSVRQWRRTSSTASGPYTHSSGYLSAGSTARRSSRRSASDMRSVN
jgi:hypothetical protein